MTGFFRLGRARVGLLALALLASGGCTKSAVQPEYPEKVTFAASLGIDLAVMTKTTSGVYYLIRSPGTEGRVDGASRVTGEFKGWLADGTQVGAGHMSAQNVIELIEGLRKGMTGMQKGEVRLIVIPSTLGYGAVPPPELGIPRNSVLVYEITVTDFI